MYLRVGGCRTIDPVASRPYRCNRFRKERLTAALLNSYANHTAFDSDWGLRTHYPKLAHPGLVEQLRPGYIIRRQLFLPGVPR